MQRHDNYKVIIASIRRNLREFGYTDLDLETVLEAYDRAMAGQPPQGIIGMMVRSQLGSNGLLPGMEDVHG